MDSFPFALTTILQTFQPLMRGEVFSSFGYLLTGLLIGEVKAGTVRARVFAPADSWPQRLSDLFCRHKLSGQALMAHLASLTLTLLYPQGVPERLWGSADATYTEKPSAQPSASVDWFHRLKYVAWWPVLIAEESQVCHNGAGSGVRGCLVWERKLGGKLWTTFHGSVVSMEDVLTMANVEQAI